MNSKFLICAFLLPVTAVVGCNRQSALDQQREAARDARIEEANQMVQRHGALKGWWKPFEEQDYPLTVDIEAAILNNESQPIVFVGMVQDVFRQEDRFYVLVESWQYSVDIVGLLECNEVLKERISKSGINGYSDYALVVSPESLRRMIWGAGSGENTSEIFVSDMGTRLLTGQLLDFTYVDTFYDG